MRCSYLVHCHFDNIAQGAKRLIDCCSFSNDGVTEEGSGLFACLPPGVCSRAVSHRFRLFPVRPSAESDNVPTQNKQ